MKNRLYICLLLLTALMLMPSFNSTAQTKSEWHYPEQYFRLAPMVVDLALPLAGVKADRDYVDILLTFGAAYVSDFVITNALKYTIREERPDGSDMHSFPSGHTSWAFTGAELIRMEYGWGWGAGAYALATATGVLRVAHDKHHWWDCAAGAGIGILSAHIGDWTRPLTRRCWNSVFGTKAELAFSPMYDPYYNATGAIFAMKF